jgi:hypothetical protein
VRSRWTTDGCHTPAVLLPPGSTLRARPNDFKAKLVQAFLDKFGDALEAGRLKPIIDEVPRTHWFTSCSRGAAE